jgi:hypothetical protein
VAVGADPSDESLLHKTRTPVSFVVVLKKRQLMNERGRRNTSVNSVLPSLDITSITCLKRVGGLAPESLKFWGTWFILEEMQKK